MFYPFSIGKYRHEGQTEKLFCLIIRNANGLIFNEYHRHIPMKSDGLLFVRPLNYVLPLKYLMGLAGIHLSMKFKKNYLSTQH